MTTFAVLEGLCGAPGVCDAPPTWTHAAVTIHGLDGSAKTRATFKDRGHIVTGYDATTALSTVTLLDLEAQVANRAVYVIDGFGALYRLDAAGHIAKVATFAIDSKYQSVSFAVRPDGKQIIAAVLTYPKYQPGTDLSQPWIPSGPWRLQIEEANAGGRSKILHQWDAATMQDPNSPGGFANIWMADWDAQGPIVLVGQGTAVPKSSLSNQRYFAGAFARLNADGTPGAPISPSNCLPYWRPVAGLFACTPSNPDGVNTVDVVSISGNVVWSGPTVLGDYHLPGDFAIAPDGTKLAMDGEVVTFADNSTIQIPSNFQPQGWLDAETVIGWIPWIPEVGAMHVGIVRLNDPQHLKDLGFRGAFVGVLSP